MNIQFIKKLYNGRNCYSDSLTKEELKGLHIESGTEDLLAQLIEQDKIVFLTGNPGDGKTYLIKTIEEVINRKKAFVVTDINSEKNFKELAIKLIDCYKTQRACIIAANEYPFLELLNEIEDIDPKISKEIKMLKKKSIIYSSGYQGMKGIAVIDLSHRSLMTGAHIFKIITRLTQIAESEQIQDVTIIRNLESLKNKIVLDQLLQLFRQLELYGKHLTIRDLLGFISFTLTGKLSNNDRLLDYYDALFEGEGYIFDLMRQIDPVYLTNPILDEQLWNGECNDGWMFEKPDKYPINMSDKYEALDCFKSLKRKYYFENSFGLQLNKLFASDLQECARMFASFDVSKDKIKREIIASINKLMFPEITVLNDKLRLWTLHGYDVSKTIDAGVSSKTLDATFLELLMPQLPEELKGLEFYPNYLVMKLKDAERPRLYLSIDFLRALQGVKRGLPINLLSEEYEQEIIGFIKELEANSKNVLYNDEIILADRRKGIKEIISIEDDGRLKLRRN